MNYFTGTLSIEEVRKVYLTLVKKYHPDKGGSNELMKAINYQYAQRINILKYQPKDLKDVRVGCRVYVNNSPCVVTEVDENSFKAKSLETHREAYFSKETGYAMLNYNYKARVKAY